MKQLSSIKQQSGFTLIELVVVIVILGILAATALPKFVDLRSDAQTSALQGVAGAMDSAMAVNYAGCSVVNNVVTANKCVQVLNCTDVSGVLQGGVPTGYTVTAAAIGAAAPASNGTSATCTLNQTSGAATHTFTGIHAGS